MYANIKTAKWDDIYLNKGTYYYKNDSTKKVTGYFYGNKTTLNYEHEGLFARQLIYYDTCKTKIKEVHSFFPGKDNGKITHFYFYDNGKKKSKLITRNYKGDKLISWDAKGRRTVTRKEIKKERMY